MVGYMGGNGTYPNYQNYTMANNYSETVRLVYDTTQTNFADLLAAYWAFVPPFSVTQPCYDPAYCLRIFYTDDLQKSEAEAAVAAQQNKTTGKILLDVLPASRYTFWKAEDYHQNYFNKTGEQCGQATSGSKMVQAQKDSGTPSRTPSTPSFLRFSRSRGGRPKENRPL